MMVLIITSRSTISSGDNIIADMIICVYTLQFVEPIFRQVFVNRIFKSLNWGGVVILFEKIS